VLSKTNFTLSFFSSRIVVSCPNSLLLLLWRYHGISLLKTVRILDFDAKLQVVWRGTYIRTGIYWYKVFKLLLRHVFDTLISHSLIDPKS
jgi:hypothetical protein